MFKDRKDAGRHLAVALEKYSDEKAIVLCIPRGGVAVGFEVARALNAALDVIIVRKIPIPWSPEAGFGAMSSDGGTVLNEPLVKHLGLSEQEIDELSIPVFDEITRRLKIYRGDKPFPDLKGEIAILVDDGLASGYTMIAAIRMVEKQQPGKIVVAVPVSSSSAYNLVKPLVDELICLYRKPYGDFAVASYYGDFHDMSDEEVLGYLKACDLK